ncbi:FAD binding domain-containing protein [Teratosphaeria nubilosa]|uniref:Delta(24)-sterol reductase n=1 Tax=Teratosphaeria nubilosa TaxID=161662 RepID=A0A6G1L5A2_9PEZI|nr:FAD binding domain-containing protein [Teratosphaeria nubilosa]
MDRHHSEVAKIAASVKSFHDRGERFRIFHGSTNSTRKSAIGRDPKKVVDTSRLNHVLSVDPESQTALVEPNVPMDRLVEATLDYGLVPPVVMEFPGITAGGGYSGTSGESSSFRHGFFDRTLKSVEMVLANGESVVTCSETQHPDLFRGAAGSLGTLGVVTLLEIQLKPAKKYVEATYHPTSSTAAAVSKIRDLADPKNEEVDYVDGILYSPTQGALITGRLVDTSTSPNTPIQRFSAPSDPWFYLHVQDKISSHSNPAQPHRELIPLPEYLFRYDRGGFWVGKAAFTYFRGLVPFNNFTRQFLDDFLHTRMLYKALHGSGHTERMFVQDLALPYRTAEDFIKYSDERLGIWPLWLCPLQPSQMPTMHPHDTSRQPDVVEKNASGPEQMLNIGLWGLGPPLREDFINANRDIEAKLKDLNGMRWVYAQTYHSSEEFWADFDKDWYDTLRKKFGAEGVLPSVYEKVKAEAGKASVTPSWGEWVKSIWPIPGFTGLRQAIKSGDYVDARASRWKGWVPRE